MKLFVTESGELKTGWGKLIIKTKTKGKEFPLSKLEAVILLNNLQIPQKAIEDFRKHNLLTVQVNDDLIRIITTPKLEKFKFPEPNSYKFYSMIHLKKEEALRTLLSFRSASGTRELRQQNRAFYQNILNKTLNGRAELGNRTIDQLITSEFLRYVDQFSSVNPKSPELNKFVLFITGLSRALTAYIMKGEGYTPEEEIVEKLENLLLPQRLFICAHMLNTGLIDTEELTPKGLTEAGKKIATKILLEFTYNGEYLLPVIFTIRKIVGEGKFQ
ncbi:hypothetical protein Theam_1532 [Thermovibrio ammonificans HB-1]|uniref:Uncharacterized protein n=1 Tax=Thermovibrio ammonificans (strain DSM 15698 / JCM 12110 / HB-1) TaxID=648996 RepID=E8T4N4_THEA1|nr:TetR-like C-terminal domain-containing protein [Thermovibrio ammonificans]ADU97492.1 hypothetical protein Theam_1532 [Thermovibrio ammonificans HB-1]